ncbi:MAG: hypothetical protein LBT82_00855 [Oscillospiraceae bacterium]|jgi:hypothetical protein|nr:hypothetical protein [Oscillospiraceae bacterium]
MNKTLVKKKAIVFLCFFGFLNGIVAYSDCFSEVVGFNARWNHGSCIGNWGSKASYSDLGKIGYYKKSRASINNMTNIALAEKDSEWAVAKQHGGWWNQTAGAGYDIREYRFW